MDYGTRRKITPEKAIQFVRIMTKLTYCWPLSETATRAQRISFKILRAFLVLNAASLCLPLTSAIYQYRNDPLIVVQLVCYTVATSQVIVQTTVCIINYKPLQSILLELTEYIRTASPWKREVLQRYTDKCAKTYAVIMIWFYFTGIFPSLDPMILHDQTFPTYAEYPFPIKSLPLKALIYAQQSLALVQCSAQICLDSFIALLIWFSAARFDILATEFRSVTTMSEMYGCIENHQSLLRSTEKVVRSVRLLSLSVVIACFISLVFNGLTLLIPTPLEAKLQFAILNLTAVLEVFMITWPAEYLIKTSTGIADGIYTSKWYESSLNIQKNMICIMMRSRKPVTVSVPCILPQMSLNYFATFISGAFSYFTTLRVFVTDEK